MKKIWIWVPALILLAGCAEVKNGSDQLYRGAFTLSQGGLVTVKVMNESGQEVKTLFKDKAVVASTLPVSWDGRGTDGQTVPVGHYSFWMTEENIELKPVAQFGGLGSTGGKFLNPQALCAYPQGSRLTVAVADTGNQRVQILTDTGGFLQATGSLGTGDGNLNQPTGVCWDGQILTVCDSQNHRLARFDERGTYLGQIIELTGLQTSISTKVILNFQNPSYIQKGSGDDFWVADSGQGILFHVTSTGGVLEEWGNPFPLSLEGPFAQIGGNFWVQSDKNHIQVVDQNGNVTDTLELQPTLQTVGGIAATAHYGIVSDPSQGLLYFVDEDGKTFQTISPPQASQPSALSVWEDHLFLIDASDHAIFHYQFSLQQIDQEVQLVAHI